MNRGVLFDLDDTLTDRAASIAEYARRFRSDFAAELEPMAPEVLPSIIHAADARGYAPRDRVFEALQANLSWHGGAAPEHARLAAHWATVFPESTVGRAGLSEVIERLRALRFVVGVVTNGGTAMQEAKLDRLGIRHLLTSWLVSEAVGSAKPDAAIFHRATAELNCRPEHVFYVGDHPHNDVLGAAAAGLNPIWLRGNHPWPSEAPPPANPIDSLHEVLAIVGSSGPRQV